MGYISAKKGVYHILGHGLIKRCLMILMLLDIGFGNVLANIDFSSKTIQNLYEIVSNVYLVLA